MITAYRVLRSDGAVDEAEGVEGWMDILSHLDVCSGCEDTDAHTEEAQTQAPAQIFRFEVDVDGHEDPLAVDLEGGESFVFVRRRYTALGGEPRGPVTIFGKRSADGSGTYIFVEEDGTVTNSPDFMRM
jgi:hypothetical protein